MTLGHFEGRFMCAAIKAGKFMRIEKSPVSYLGQHKSLAYAKDPSKESEIGYHPCLQAQSLGTLFQYSVFHFAQCTLLLPKLSDYNRDLEVEYMKLTLVRDDYLMNQVYKSPYRVTWLDVNIGIS